jgi:hypothetical protein
MSAQKRTFLDSVPMRKMFLLRDCTKRSRKSSGRRNAEGRLNFQFSAGMSLVHSKLGNHHLVYNPAHLSAFGVHRYSGDRED